ncbi:protein MIZU-KUSSEI 1-like [Ipomoea triloba]|uniref:protein MIZU-KUSSEI 1-like n=1 Tax=Ipomoea triloba TaxID=35885 RepID=UPI00125E1B54|nr:protein MIZU-KUSSEI 1-like [Ipomoea triloba]
MKTIMAKSIQDSPSKRHFHWTTKVSNEEEENPSPSDTKSSDVKQEEDPKKIVSPLKPHQDQESSSSSAAGTSRQGRAVSRLKSVVSSIRMNRIMQLLMKQRRRLGTKVVGTLFGYRRGGNLHFAVQKESASEPVFLVELAVPISGLVREMASDLVRITLECDKGERTKGLLDEAVWRTYCDGKKCGLANRRECGAKEWEILKSVEPISIGAGVLRIENSDGGDGGGFSAAGEIMYLRATFERVVGSRDSEAFYMMDPDTNGAPELGLYLLRV